MSWDQIKHSKQDNTKNILPYKLRWKSENLQLLHDGIILYAIVYYVWYTSVEFKCIVN